MLRWHFEGGGVEEKNIWFLNCLTEGIKGFFGYAITDCF